MDKKTKQLIIQKIEQIQADVYILEKKHEFLMEILTEEQLEQYQAFCEEHGF